LAPPRFSKEVKSAIFHRIPNPAKPEPNKIL
jgi:hypothetical protein